MSTTTHLMTAEELFNLPDGPYRHELIKGELLTMPSPGAKHSVVSINLSAPLAVYVKAKKLGVVTADAGFILERNPDTVLGPDISFIRSERISTIPDGYLELVPDLVIEVVSPSQSRPKMERKASQWLEHGAQGVWLVNPRTRTIEVRRATGESQQLLEGDDLTGGDLVPGFRIPVSEIFA
jgi:Uma2 family endonuclease